MPAQLARLVGEDPDELVADDPPLLLGVGDAGEAGEEAFAGVDHDQVHPEVALKRHTQQLGLALAQQAVVDEDAGQLVADRAVDQRGRHRRVDAAGEGADDPPVADLLADLARRSSR